MQSFAQLRRYAKHLEVSGFVPKFQTAMGHVKNTAFPFYPFYKFLRSEESPALGLIDAGRGMALLTAITSEPVSRSIPGNSSLYLFAVAFYAGCYAIQR